MTNTQNSAEDVSSPEELGGQECPMCREKTLTLMEADREIPYFGMVYIYSMSCSNCKYHKADIESAEAKDPMRYEIEISSEEDLKIRVVKSSTATIKLPHVTTVTPGIASNGYVTNIEGILNRVKNNIELASNSEEDEEIKKKAKNLLKKLQKVAWGHENMKMIIEDPTGNSAIISPKAVVTKMKMGKQ